MNDWKKQQRELTARVKSSEHIHSLKNLAHLVVEYEGGRLEHHSAMNDTAGRVYVRTKGGGLVRFHRQPGMVNVEWARQRAERLAKELNNLIAKNNTAEPEYGTYEQQQAQNVLNT